MDAVTWGRFRDEQPDLAAHVEARFAGAPCFLATVRADGFPRVHPVGVNVRGDELIVPMFPTSPKGHDLRRSGGYAAHCAVEDDDGGGGEVLLTGTATEVDATEEFASRGWITFELRIGEVLSIRHGDDGPIVTRWKPGA